MQKIKKYICKVYIPHSSDKTTVYAAKALDLVEVYIPHSSDKTTGQILSFTDTIYVYIPHSSDKTFTSLPMNSKSNLFTSLIVQIRRITNSIAFEGTYEFTSLIVQIRLPFL